jgi:methyl-accepting chemotaxis protein
MKGRLNSTIWMIVGFNAAACAVVLFLAYAAGAHGGVSILDFSMMSSAAFARLGGAVVLLIVAAIVTVSWLGSAISKPVQKLADFSDKVAGGDYKAKAEIETQDDFGYIAENLNRSMDKAARAVSNQDAQEGLQRSVTEFLTIVSQIARGDLTLRGKVTNDALATWSTLSITCSTTSPAFSSVSARAQSMSLATRTRSWSRQKICRPARRNKTRRSRTLRPLWKNSRSR